MKARLLISAERVLPQTAALTSVLSSKDSLLLEQQRCFELVLSSFVQSLSLSDTLFASDAWGRHGEWSDAEHRLYETWGWFRHFCRSVSTTISYWLVLMLAQYIPQLIGHSQTLRPKLDEKLSQQKGSSGQLLQKYCALALSEAR